MTAALCINCGKLKHGLLSQCDHCGELPPKEITFEIFLSDHYLSVDTLKEFGRVIKRLSIVANDKPEAYWAFMYLLSEYYPEIIFADVPKAFRVSSKILLKDLDLDPIVIKKGRFKTDKNDPESKYATIVDYSDTQCPYCGVKKSLAAWRLFNGYTDASLKLLIFEGRIFQSRCLKCQKIQSVRNDMVYFDIEPKPIIIFLDNPKADPEHQINHVPKEYFNDLFENFLYRKVNRPIELIEKIKIFDDGVDDIEVELAKHLLSLEMGMDVTERLHYHEMQSGFFKKKTFTFRDRKNELGMLTYQMKDKKGQAARLLPLMRDKLKQQRSEWPVVKAETLIKLLGSEAKYK
ncbi:MAG: CpXC domain-containing protein, partial [Gracilimonas sp.]